MPSVYEMGNLIKLRQETDNEHRITNHIRSHLSCIDLQPVNYQLTLANINKAWGVAYHFDEAAKDYAEVLDTYALPPKDMLRLWLTDDTVVSDNFTNNFNANIIESGINSLSGVSSTVKTMQAMRSTGNDTSVKVGEAITGTVSSGIDSLVSGLFPESELAGELSNQAQAITNTVGEVIFQGKHISLPKIWTSSTYNPSLTVTIKLVSPYGSSEAIKAFIIEPLMYLLALVSPKTDDGLSYGLSQPLYVNGYGISNMNLAAVQNITMRRGGRETAFNIYKQPLILDIMLTIQPLADGFASVVNNDDVATITDAAKPATTGGMNGPAITTLGNIIQSLRPAPNNITGADVIKEKTRHRNSPMGKNISSASSAAANC